ncbi:MAG TPA: MerR family transcriptional regulator [Bacillota bacterium]|nr:MerR family transcriptional regulator [Bacillota bacterium]
MAFKVKEVSELVGVSVRTLHHYDQIGLLIPESVSPAGYRLYSDRNLERLQQIMFFKEIGFELHEIKQILDSPGFDRRQALLTHRELLLEKKKRLEEIIGTVEKTINSIEGEGKMNNKEMFAGFDMSEIEKHQAKYAEETKQKYGQTEAYQESAKKTAKYTKDDWARITADAGRIYQKIAAAMDKGPADPGVQQAVGEWRQHITTNYYNCTPEIFRGLGDLYVNDPRFTANIDKTKPGLAAFLREAMHIYCDNLEK